MGRRRRIEGWPLRVLLARNVDGYLFRREGKRFVNKTSGSRWNTQARPRRTRTWSSPRAAPRRSASAAGRAPAAPPRCCRCCRRRLESSRRTPRRRRPPRARRRSPRGRRVVSGARPATAARPEEGTHSPTLAPSENTSLILLQGPAHSASPSVSCLCARKTTTTTRLVGSAKFANMQISFSLRPRQQKGCGRSATAARERDLERAAVFAAVAKPKRAAAVEARTAQFAAARRRRRGVVVAIARRLLRLARGHRPGHVGGQCRQPPPPPPPTGRSAGVGSAATAPRRRRARHGRR